MAGLTRRDLMKSSAAVAAATTAPAARARPAPHRKTAPALTPSMRDRALLDFGWRFHLGHACDPDKDFGFGLNQHTFAKAGTDVAAAAMLDFDDSAWTGVNLPHDWAVELPFAPSDNPPAGKTIRAPRTASGRWAANIPRPASAGIGASSTSRRPILGGVCRSSSTASSAMRLVMFNGYIVASARRRLHAVPRRCHRLRQLRRQECRWPCASTRRWAKAGSTKARVSIAMSGWSRPIPCTSRNGVAGSEATRIAGGMAALTVSTEVVNESGTVRKCQVVCDHARSQRPCGGQLEDRSR